jgi:hypothetical protein
MQINFSKMHGLGNVFTTVFLMLMEVRLNNAVTVPVVLHALCQ